jgi:CO/xanthine dehydrogenase FAD-binding subunit
VVRFEYLEPATLKEAVAILTRYGQGAKVLAGGTDLLKRLKERTLKPRFVVNIKGIPELNGISHSPGNGVRIGALTILHDLENSLLLKERYSALAQAGHSLGSPQVRNLATIGGNVCNAAPSAETAPSLLVLSASVRTFGPQGERTLPLESFFLGPGATILQEGEVLTELILPESLPGAGAGSAYIKLCPRGSMDLAVVGVAAMAALSPYDGSVEECRIGLGAVAPTPMRAKRAEILLRGQKPTEHLVHEAAQKAAEESNPISDIRGSAEYRREMVKLLTFRALGMALERANNDRTGREKHA